MSMTTFSSPAGSAVSLSVQQLINERALSRLQWRVFGLCFIIVLLDGMDTAAIGYIAPALMQEWGMARSALAPVLSAALFGVAGGALMAGPLADRLGRKWVLVVAVAMFGAASLGSAWAASLDALVAWRFVTGLGLGAAMPAAVTLVNEYCPDQRRSMLTNAIFCGFPLGAALGGAVAAWLIPLGGWRAVLLLGGVLPLMLAGVAAVLLPESIRHMVAHGHAPQRIRRVLAAIAGQEAVRDVQHFTLEAATSHPAALRGAGVLLSPRYRVGTLMLWLAYFMGLVIFYALINWMPVLLRDVGLDARAGSLIAALFPLGGVGAVAVGWLMDRFDGNRIIAVCYALAAASVWWIGQAAGSMGWLMVAVFCAGVAMNTAQASMPALAAAYYPTQGRATGVAWMLGVGRFGGIAGAFLVAQLTAWELDFGQIFGVVALPGLLAVVALLLKRRSDAPHLHIQAHAHAPQCIPASTPFADHRGAAAGALGTPGAETSRPGGPLV